MPEPPALRLRMAQWVPCRDCLHGYGEERFLAMVWPKVGEIHDLDFVQDGRRGVFYRKDKPLNLVAQDREKERRRI